MSQLNFIVERFKKGDANFSDVPLYLNATTPVYSNFGQCLDATEKFLHYTLERRDTLIPEGEYPYCFYNSPENGWCLLLKNVPGFSMIEHHPANWVVAGGKYLLKGCTSHGLYINVKTPSLLNCRLVLKPFFDTIVNNSGKILAGPVGTIIDGDFGTFTYRNAA